jgi:predicted double-glycine peptidase
VVSIQEARYENIVRQQTDFSCGAAAIATILRYAYGMKTDEADVLNGMFKFTNPATINERGFSMLDIKHYVESIGLEGLGYRLTLAQLQRVRVPTIVLVNLEGYEHFVVLKKAAEDMVYVADPVLGNRRMDARAFNSEWNGIVLAIAGRAYRRENPLLDVQAPMTADRLLEGVVPLVDPLSNLTTLAVGVTPTSRLP